MEEQQKPPEEKQEPGTIPSGKYPWIVAGMGIMLLTLWNKLADKDEEIKRLNGIITNTSLQIAPLAVENSAHAIEVARLTKQLMDRTNENDTKNSNRDTGSGRGLTDRAK